MEIAGAAVLIGLLLNVVLMGLAVVVLGLMPADYFVRERGHRGALIRIVRNVIGGVLAVLGALMLVAPGPGLVMVVSGLMLIDSRYKTRLLRRLVTRPPVYRTISRMRGWFNKPPFTLSDEMAEALADRTAHKGASPGRSA